MNKSTIAGCIPIKEQQGPPDVLSDIEGLVAKLSKVE